MASDRRRILVETVSETRLARAKRSFTTRRVPLDAPRTLIAGTVRPRSGDLVLARLERFGQHTKLERPDGRRVSLHLGDELVVAYGDRYAPDQFEAQVPPTLGATQLVASGGIAAAMLSRSRDVRRATDIQPLGLLGDERGRPLNLADFALRAAPPTKERPPTIAVIGTSMNSGKTTTIRYLVHTLALAGHKPAATKVTGTGSGGDFWVMVDAGAHSMLDFTDVGLASTYRQPMPVLERAFRDLVQLSTDSGSTVNLVEIADGIYQQETAALIESAAFRDLVDVVVFAASDAMGAAAGVSHLRNHGHEVAAVSGKITRSPLATREAEAAIGLPVLSTADLADSDMVAGLIGLDPLTAVPSIPRQAAWPLTVDGLAPPEPWLDPDSGELTTLLDDDFVWSAELAPDAALEQP